MTLSYRRPYIRSLYLVRTIAEISVIVVHDFAVVLNSPAHTRFPGMSCPSVAESSLLECAGSGIAI